MTEAPSPQAPDSEAPRPTFPAEGLFLIAHKVRGELAFDVAHQLPNDVWITSSYGHRAYPLASWPLDSLLAGDLAVAVLEAARLLPTAQEHFSTRAAPAPSGAASKPKAKAQRITAEALSAIMSNLFDEED